MGSFDNMILILYGVITVFFIYRIFKQQRDKKHLGSDIKSFKRPISSMEAILFSILIVTAIVNLYQGYKVSNKNSMMVASIMIVLALVFAIYSTTKLYIADNGMLINTGFVSFKELKKWGFDQERGDLVMAIKKDGNTNRESTKVRKEDIEEINDLIRKHKLGK
ncbi:DUF986 family protein [Anaerococcus sp. NML200574]|uniref:DUF986 family protein n=1 Tax=Anaerococcus kampingae TaxID=3115614 RepID=A0ABW9MER2_9FIRM|nr:MULTISPECIES: DUF986 family protein [unclassified Anaerococcus]MCW6678720.1 DUF986 family protein [Anaerococcus sp. NML200574]MCW6701685.1 DUF986 family protein [Anaerococcus sp. NML200537]